MQDLLASIWTKVVKAYQAQEESGKLTEKAFVRRIAVGIISIVFCLSAMGISAYAFFTSNVTSEKNILTAATYEVNAVVKAKDTGTAIAPTQGTTDVYVLNKNVYEIQLAVSGNAQNGYCKIELLDGVNVAETYYTRPLAPGSSITFQITCHQAGTIKITPNWGSYAGYIQELPQEGEADKLLYKDGAWLNTFAIGTPTTTIVEGEKAPEQEQISNEDEVQNLEEQQIEGLVEEPVTEETQGEKTADAEE